MESEWTGGSAYVSGAQRFLARSLFIFFSKPLLFLLPALVVTSIGGYLATTTPDEYQSIGVLSVSSETFLDVLTGSRSNGINHQGSRNVWKALPPTGETLQARRLGQEE